jgi:hypothetical protein
LQSVLDWISTMAENSSVEEEDGKLCARGQMSWQSQLVVKFPSLPTHAMLEKASCAAFGVLTPSAAYTVNDKGGATCLTVRVNQQVTQGKKVEHPTGVARSALQSRRFRNHGSKCLDAHDVRCTMTCYYRLGNHHLTTSSSTMRTTS